MIPVAQIARWYKQIDWQPHRVLQRVTILFVSIALLVGLFAPIDLESRIQIIIIALVGFGYATLAWTPFFSQRRALVDAAPFWITITNTLILSVFIYAFSDNAPMIAVLYLLAIVGVATRRGLAMALWSAFFSSIAYLAILAAQGYLLAQFDDAVILIGTFWGVAILTGALAQAAQKRSQEFENMFQRSREGIAIMDEQARFIDLNPAMLAMFGYALAELRQRALFDFITDPNDLRNTRVLWPRLVNHPLPREVFIIHLRAKDGSIRILATSLAGLSDHPRRYLGIARDITQQEAERLAHERCDRELEAERRVALAVSEGTGLTQVMELALAQAVNALQVDAGSIYLANDSQTELTMAVAHNLPPRFALDLQHYCFGDGITGQAASQRQVVIASDLNLANSARLVSADGTGISQVSVPLVAQDRVVGVLNINGVGGRQFNDADVALLRAIASSVALAIDHARLFDSLEQRVNARTAELLALNHIASQANQSLDLDTITNRTLRELIEALHLPGGWITLVDPERKLLVSCAEIGMPPGLVHTAQRQRLGDGFVGQIALDQQARTFNIEDMPSPMRETVLEQGIHSICGIPLIVAGQTVGVLGLAARHSNRFDSELRWLTTAANAIATAIRNAQLYASMEQQVKELAALREIDRSLNSTLELEPMLALTLTSVAQVVPYDRAVVYILQGTQMRAIAAHGIHPNDLPHYYFQAQGDVAFEQMSNLGKTLVMNQIDVKALKWNPIPDLELIRAWMGTPLIARGAVIGQISLYSHVQDIFTNEHAEWMQSFSSHASVTIANALLRVQLNEQARRDSLTLALNHGAFIEELRAACRLAQEKNQPLALIMLDLDNFKEYNDTFGHVIGDKVLQAMVQAIHQHIKHTDHVGRWGGEEFGVAMLNSDHVGAMRVAQRIRQTLAEIEIVDQHGARIPPPTASQGIDILGDTTFDPDELIERADRALYRAKAQGRDQVVCADCKP